MSSNRKKCRMILFFFFRFSVIFRNFLRKVFPCFTCSLPPWAEKLKSDSDFENLLNFESSIYTRRTECKKIRSGYLLKEILDRSTSKTKSTLLPDRSLWMYFAHYSTIRDMLSSLGLPQVLNHFLHSKEREKRKKYI